MGEFKSFNEFNNKASSSNAPKNEGVNQGPKMPGGSTIKAPSYDGEEKDNSKILNIIIIVVAIIVILVLLIWAVTTIKNINGKKDATNAVEEFNKNIVWDDAPKKNTVNDTNKNAALLPVNMLPVEGQTQGGNGLTAEKLYKGFTMLGTLEIPKIQLKYPILARANDKSMKVAVARAYGGDLNEPGNVVIMGHNYRDRTFFSNLHKVKNGDTIYVTDLQKRRKAYKIYNMYITTASDISYIDRDTKGGCEVTLVTCTDDVKGRLIIWAKEVK